MVLFINTDITAVSALQPKIDVRKYHLYAPLDASAYGDATQISCQRSEAQDTKGTETDVVVHEVREYGDLTEKRDVMNMKT